VRPKDGESFPVHTIILPVEPEKGKNPDALEMLLNPEAYKVDVSYIYFFAFDSVQLPAGFHVGDLEHTSIQFDKGSPVRVDLSWHSWDKILDWADVHKEGKHPITYNGRGTHATYETLGVHFPQFDWTESKEVWHLWKNLDVIFPWDLWESKRIIKTDSNADGANYLTHVWRWGNLGDGPTMFGQRARESGPSGFLDKPDGSRQFELESTGFVCEGDDTERCPWPWGVFSYKNQLCESGFSFSYLARKCY